MDLEDLEGEIRRLTGGLTPVAAALARLTGTGTERRLAKGEHLCRQGDSAGSLYFVRSGLLRYYYLADGVEHTGQFFDEGKFTADVAAVVTGAPCLQNIDALEPSVVLALPRLAMLAAFDEDHALERFGRRLMEEVMAGAQRRTASLLQLTAEERYERFIAQRPEIARRVPQYVVASYLGVTPEALSRIRRRRTGG